MDNIEKNKDILPVFGPYSKKYMGISKIIKGSFFPAGRFDLTVFPTIANSSVSVPNVTVPSDYHPWEAKEDLSYFSYRYDLIWKDTTYAEVSFSKITEDRYLVRTELINNSELKQNYLVNYFSSIEFPYEKYVTLELPEKAFQVKATDYESYDYEVKRPWDSLNPDGFKKGEFLDSSFTYYKGLGDRVGNSHLENIILEPFGAVKGDRVIYRLNLNEDYKEASLSVRYRTVSYKYDKAKDNNAAEFRVVLRNANNKSNKDSLSEEIKLLNSTELKISTIDLGILKKGSYNLELESLGTKGVELDFIAVTEKENAEDIKIIVNEVNPVPNMKIESQEICYSYDGVEEKIRVKALGKDVRYRSLETGALEDALITRLSNSDHTFDDLLNPFTKSFSRKKSDFGFFHNIISHSIYINPGEKAVDYLVIGIGEGEYLSINDYEKIYNKRKRAVNNPIYRGRGREYELSNQILKTTLLTNVVYPIYKYDNFIIHHTPGKRWDCLYTWDSGFIGLGLLEVSEKLSEYILDTYLSESDNRDFAFLMHGSPVPVQIYLLLEMLQKTNSKEKYLKYYDRAKRMYEFLAGKGEGSTTNMFKTNLLSTYNYFYNSSGMDDLPPQVYMHGNKLQAVTSPSLTTSHVIRGAKILKMIAHELKRHEDILEFDRDIEKFGKALLEYSWDEQSGYFSYVVHDENLNKKEILRTENNENLDKGMDGIYPVISGILPEDKNGRIISHLKSEKEMFSEVGISAVDMSSTYYKHNGYWNGNVWFPHQWFIWKTMLDLGENNFAFRIADTALKSWAREVDSSYYTFEMLNIETGRGGWFHHFGGLSAPINIWANAYYKAGSVTSGFDIWIEKKSFAEDFLSGSISFKNYSESKESIVIVTLSDTTDEYSVFCDDETLNYYLRDKGILEIRIPKKNKYGTIKIKGEV